MTVYLELFSYDRNKKIDLFRFEGKDAITAAFRFLETYLSANIVQNWSMQNYPKFQASKYDLIED